MLFCAIAYGAEPIQPIFVPVIVEYKGGSFQSVRLSGDEWFDNLRDCKNAADKQAMSVIESDTGDISVKVACLPVPSKNPQVDAK
jgi:hypothetical protein